MSNPDLQFFICMGSHQHYIKNPRPDQSCCECCSCRWIHFFVGLPHQVGDTLATVMNNLILISVSLQSSSFFPHSSYAKRRRRKEKEISTKKLKCMLPFPHFPSLFSLSRYTSECPSHPFPSTFSRFPSPVIPLNPHLIPSQVLVINEINNTCIIKIFVF